jgi:hypothetical protein
VILRARTLEKYQVGQVHHLPTVCPWTNYLPVWYTFLICNVGIKRHSPDKVVEGLQPGMQVGRQHTRHVS